MRLRTLTYLVMAAAEASCHGGVCPDIGCLPKISMAFANAISGQYSLSVAVSGKSYQATCPSSNFNVREGIDTCDASGFNLVGVDLGHGDNLTLVISTSIDNSSPIESQARLVEIQNSRDCDLVCYSHQGIVAN